MATATTNELFSDISPDNTPAQIFLETHKDIVEKELANLKDDTELLTMVHMTLSEEIGVRFAYDAGPKEIENTFNKLRRLGLLVPVKNTSTDEFINYAHAFYKKNVGNEVPGLH